MQADIRICSADPKTRCRETNVQQIKWFRLGKTGRQWKEFFVCGRQSYSPFPPRGRQSLPTLSHLLETSDGCLSLIKRNTKAFSTQNFAPTCTHQSYVRSEVLWKRTCTHFRRWRLQAFWGTWSSRRRNSPPKINVHRYRRKALTAGNQKKRNLSDLRWLFLSDFIYLTFNYSAWRLSYNLLTLPLRSTNGDGY